MFQKGDLVRFTTSETVPLNTYGLNGRVGFIVDYECTYPAMYRVLVLGLENTKHPEGHWFAYSERLERVDVPEG